MDLTSSDAVAEHHEVVVVGARCAGAATAMLLARAGVDVVVIDRAEFPSDTVSTHAVARGGVVQLSRWGLLERVVESGAPPIRSVSFHIPGHQPTERMVRDRAGVDHLIAPRRHVLDMILLQAAQDAGATALMGVNVTGITADRADRVSGVVVRDREGARRTIRARVVVGADGVRSRIARAVHAKVLEQRPLGGATTYAYVAGLDAERFEFEVGNGSLAGVFPTHGGEANVWICTPSSPEPSAPDDRSASFLRLLDRRAPVLAEWVRTGAVVSPVRGAVALPNHVLQAAGPGWALVGDAGYHRDPITGHGITDAFRDAELLARALIDVVRGDASEATALTAYGKARHRALVPIFDVTSRLSQLPPVDEIVDLQKQLSALLDLEADHLAALPPLPGPALAGTTAA